MKRIIALIMTVVTVFCLGACFNSREKKPMSNSDSQNKIVIPTQGGEVTMGGENLSPDELNKMRGEGWGEVNNPENEKAKGLRYTNEIIGIDFTIPAGVYSHQDGDNVIHLWDKADVDQTKKSGLIPVMAAKKTVPGELVNNVAMYLEKVDDDVTAEMYITKVAESKEVNSISEPKKVKLEEEFKLELPGSAETGSVINLPEAWVMKRTVSKGDQEATQHLTVFKKDKYMVTIIITADNNNLKVIKEEWFSVPSADK